MNDEAALQRTFDESDRLSFRAGYIQAVSDVLDGAVDCEPGAIRAAADGAAAEYVSRIQQLLERRPA